MFSLLFFVIIIKKVLNLSIEGDVMNDNIFSGLEDMGLGKLDELQLFGKKQEAKEDTAEKKEESPLVHLYDQEVTCPICGNKFKVKSVKASSYRVMKKDSDFFIRYANVNPYFYDVWLCNVCGYASMKSDFNKLRSFQIEKVQKNISMKWTGRNYPELYTAEVAIERYKLSLYNSVVIEAKASRKAMNCLKIAWMYRLLEDEKNEQLFLNQALSGFTEAYSTEDFPLYGMDRFTSEYLIAELNRSVGNYDEANRWYGKVILASNAPQKIKDLARDQRDLAKQAETASEEEIGLEEDTSGEEKNKKSGFFSKLFGK
jgi:uncharacterized protein (DUF2225 family)